MQSPTEKNTILIVDDIPDNLLLLEKILRKLDVEVVKATSGNEALKATLYNDFSLILLDIVMPGMDGFEVAEMLKQEEATANIPIIFISAMDRDEDFEIRAYGKGAIDFLYKPFNEVILLSKVRILLDLYSMNRDIEKALVHKSKEKPKILVVDDTPDNILVLRKLLSRLDAEVVAASSGNEALTATIYDDFAVIFLDVQMPGMDGYEVAELLKSNDKTATIPIIFITAIDRDDAKEIKGYGTGAVDFIFKPFNEFILLSKARVFLEIHAMKAGLGALVAERTAALKESNIRLLEEIERKEVIENELRRTRSYLSSVVNSISSVIIGVDTEGTISDMNLEAVKISGISANDAQGRKIDEVFPFFAEINAELLGLVDRNRPVMRPYTAITRNDKVFIYNFAIYPLVGKDTGQAVIRADDVTEAKKMEEELQQRRHIESLGQLAGGIAHDFNNMLSAISGSAELLRLKAGDNKEFASLLDGIFVAVERSADLTGKLLSFARKKGGKKSNVDMHGLVSDTVAILQRSIDKRITIKVITDAADCFVEGDESELHNALLNLGINARDAMPDGGTLTIRTCNRQIEDRHEAHTLELNTGYYLELSVEDNGIGMSDEVRKKVFEPFFTTKAQGKGTGLGLASVYGTIKAHTGAIQLRTALGKGTTFTMLLPASCIAEDMEKPPPSEQESAEIKGAVLLVDDEDVVRKVGGELLEELGMDVIEAANGKEAIELVKERGEELSLILLDMVMPEMNGQDCFAKIKTIMPEARVILCSGYAPDEMISRLHLEGIKGYIRKPFRIADLKAVVLSALANNSEQVTKAS